MALVLLVLFDGIWKVFCYDETNVSDANNREGSRVPTALPRRLGMWLSNN